MTAKRASARPAATAVAPASPLVNATLLAAASAYALWLLVARGRVSWPPSDLIASLYTLAGCFALVGPVVLVRRLGPDSGVGDTLWMVGGLLTWLFNLSALIRGEGRLATIATPIASSTMGLVMLAVLMASWRTRGGSRSWSWTNVAGWALGVFWVCLAGATHLPGNPMRLSLR
jgi:hypothetical protein